MPAYTISEAARYLRLPKATLRAWVKGQDGSQPVLALPDPKSPYLSFLNLVEAYVLSAIRSEKVPLQRVRVAVKYLAQQFGAAHPLLSAPLLTDGVDLFIERVASLINVSKGGQEAMREVVELFLRRIEWDARHLPLKLYPFTRPPSPLDPKLVEINPAVAFGHPIVRDRGVRTDIIAQRFRAGDSIEHLANDYGLETSEIEEAIRFETPAETPAA